MSGNLQRLGRCPASPFIADGYLVVGSRVPVGHWVVCGNTRTWSWSRGTAFKQSTDRWRSSVFQSPMRFEVADISRKHVLPFI